MWYISKDKIDDGRAVDAWNGDAESIDTAKQRCKCKFRMSDDDGEIYYYGYSDDDSDLDPLDDFGMPNAGCTTIEYYDCGTWETL